MTDPEYLRLFDDLICGRAEDALREAALLRSCGYEPVVVKGLKSVIWEKEGCYWTTEAAVAEQLAIKEQDS